MGELEELKDLKKDAIERAAQSIVSYMDRRGFTEFPIIGAKSFNQRGYLKVFVKPNPETMHGCIVELGYDYPNKWVREEICDRVINLVKDKLMGKE